MFFFDGHVISIIWFLYIPTFLQFCEWKSPLEAWVGAIDANRSCRIANKHHGPSLHRHVEFSSPSYPGSLNISNIYQVTLLTHNLTLTGITSIGAFLQRKIVGPSTKIYQNSFPSPRIGRLKFFIYLETLMVFLTTVHTRFSTIMLNLASIVFVQIIRIGHVLLFKLCVYPLHFTLMSVTLFLKTSSRCSSPCQGSEWRPLSVLDSAEVTFNVLVPPLPALSWNLGVLGHVMTMYSNRPVFFFGSIIVCVYVCLVISGSLLWKSFFIILDLFIVRLWRVLYI